MRQLSIVLILGIMVAGCATARSIHPIIFEGPDFDRATYQRALEDCYRMIEAQAPGIDSGANVVGNALSGTGIGAVAGAIIGGAVGNPGRGAALGAAAGSTAGGLSGYGATEREKRQVYHQAITQCLTLKGYQVLGATGRLR
jgi:uncharacterized protein YcfJ